MSRKEGCLSKAGVLGKVQTAISSNTTTAGAVIDTAGYEKITFLIYCSAYTDGTYTPLINESDDSGMSGESAVADADLVAFGSGAPEANAALGAVGYKFISYTGSKRYITLDIVSTSVTSGATLAWHAILENPTINPIGA